MENLESVSGSSTAPISQPPALSSNCPPHPPPQGGLSHRLPIVSAEKRSNKMTRCARAANSFTGPAALRAGMLVSLIKVSRRPESTEPEGEVGRLSFPLHSPWPARMEPLSPQRAVLVCALCWSTHLTRQVCALSRAGPERPRILLWFGLLRGVKPT